MACTLNSDSKRLYSWWWDSHIIPKNSKWLQENLTDMDTKVKSMIRLIEEDADSFARRAEMYYKKRPELVKLVEEFYRAYRALAERYDHATSELHHAQKTLQAAFPVPDHEPFSLPEDSSSTIDPHAQNNDSFGLQLFLEGKLQSTNEKDECGVEKLKSAFTELTEEKEALRLLYEECLDKSFKLELDLSSGQSDVQHLTTKILNSTKELKLVHEICVCLEASNQSLKMEVGNFAKKIMLKDQELSEKHDELKQMKERLEDEEALQLGQCTSMKNEIFHLKEEISKLNMSYGSLTSQVELFDLNPNLFGSPVKYVQDEDSSLKQICEKSDYHEEQMKTIMEKNTDLKTSLESLHFENSATFLEKTVLSSQLHINTVKTEIENLKERSKGLEELCELLNDEKSSLSSERSMLASELESVQKRLYILENQFIKFENEKDTENSQMRELVTSLTDEKQEQERCTMMNQKRFDNLVNNIQELHKESKLKKEDFQEELDKAVIAEFENFILHKFVRDVEEENYSFLVQNRKHIEASKLADKLISELETEILEQQVEEELLLLEVENLRLGIYQLSSSLDPCLNPANILIEEIIVNIDDLKHSLVKQEDDNQRLVIENNVISTVLMNEYATAKDDFFKVNIKNLDLVEASGNLGLELYMLDVKIEERKNIEENLTTELQERDNEFELCNAEAIKFVFDLQMLNTRGLLFEDKVHELAELCERLEVEAASKDQEIEEMKQKANVMETEIEGLKAQLCAYSPVIGSLKKNIRSLEHNVLTVANVSISYNRKDKDMELKAHSHSHHNQSDPGPNSLEPNGILDLIEVQTRISALEKVILKDINTIGRRKSPGINIRPKLASLDTEDSKSMEKLTVKHYLALDQVNIPKARPELSEVRKGVPVRDIQLDQASAGSSPANSRSRSRRRYLRSDHMLIEQLPYEPQIEELVVDRLQVLSQETNKGKILKTLASDANKLANLETTVKDLTERLDVGNRCKKPIGVDLKIVKEQLERVKKTILQLTNVNVEAITSTEKNPSLAACVEQDETWKLSERIKTLQMDVQRIQCVLLKVDEGKNNIVKSRFSMSKSRTSVILRDFIHHGRNNSGRIRRRRLCGCFTSSLTKGDRIKG